MRAKIIKFLINLPQMGKGDRVAVDEVSVKLLLFLILFVKEEYHELVIHIVELRLVIN